MVAGLAMDRSCKTAIIADKELERATVAEGTEVSGQECFSRGKVKAVHVPASVRKIEGSTYDANEK